MFFTTLGHESPECFYQESLQEKEIFDGRRKRHQIQGAFFDYSSYFWWKHFGFGQDPYLTKQTKIIQHDSHSR